MNDTVEGLADGKVAAPLGVPTAHREELSSTPLNGAPGTVVGDEPLVRPGLPVVERHRGEESAHLALRPACIGDAYSIVGE